MQSGTAWTNPLDPPWRNQSREGSGPGQGPTALAPGTTTSKGHCHEPASCKPGPAPGRTDRRHHAGDVPGHRPCRHILDVGCRHVAGDLRSNALDTQEHRHRHRSRRGGGWRRRGGNLRGRDGCGGDSGDVGPGWRRPGRSRRRNSRRHRGHGERRRGRSGFGVARGICGLGGRKLRHHADPDRRDHGRQFHLGHRQERRRRLPELRPRHGHIRQQGGHAPGRSGRGGPPGTGSATQGALSDLSTGKVVRITAKKGAAENTAEAIVVSTSAAATGN